MPNLGYLTPREIVELTGVKIENVLVWIARGELVAVDMSAASSQRPRWRIAIAEWDRFTQSCQSAPPAPVPAARRRRKSRPTREWV